MNFVFIVDGFLKKNKSRYKTLIYTLEKLHVKWRNFDGPVEAFSSIAVRSEEGPIILIFLTSEDSSNSNYPSDVTYDVSHVKSSSELESLLERILDALKKEVFIKDDVDVKDDVQDYVKDDIKNYLNDYKNSPLKSCLKDVSKLEKPEAQHYFSSSLY